MKDNIKWIILVFVLTFVLSACFSGVATLVSDINVILTGIILAVVILIGIIADMIGVAVLSGNEATFHAKASRKIKGAGVCVNLIRSASKVSSVCNDIIGDICGILSGALGTTLALFISGVTALPHPVCALIVAAGVSTLTVGGKALCKSIAVKNSDGIIFALGSFLAIFQKK